MNFNFILYLSKINLNYNYTLLSVENPKISKFISNKIRQHPTKSKAVTVIVADVGCKQKIQID